MRRLGKLILSACAAAAIRRPWLVMGAAALLTAVAAYASTGLTIDTGTDNILAADLPFRQAERAYEAAFPKKEAAVVVVDAATPERSEAAARSLAKRLKDRPNLFTKVEIPGDDPYFERTALLFLDPGRLRSVAEQLSQAQPLFSVLGPDPSLRGLAQFLGLLQAGAGIGAIPPEFSRILSELAQTIAARADGRAATMDWSILVDMEPDQRSSRQLVTAQPVLDNTSLQRAGPALSALGRDIEAVRAEQQSVTIRVTGDPVLRQQELNDALSGALYASGLSFLLVALSLVVGIRSGRLILALLITLIVGSVWTTGLAAVAVGRLNLISIAFMVLFFGLGVDFGTHLGLRYLEEARGGVSFKRALTRAMAGEGAGIGLSALCAALGFLAFVPTAYVGLAEFGIISALGMVVAVVITFTVQPALMAILPPRKGTASGVNIGVGRFIQRHHRSILVVAVAVTVAAAFAAGRAQIDVNPLNLQNQQAEAVRTYRDLAKDPETSPYALNVLAPNRGSAGELATKLAALEGVAQVRTAESFIPKDQPPKLEVIGSVRSRLGSSLDNQQSQPPPDAGALQQALESLRSMSAAIASAAPSDSPLGQAAARFAAALRAFVDRHGTDPQAIGELDAALMGGLPGLMRDLREKLSIGGPVSVADLPPDLRRDWIAPDGRMRLQVLPDEDIGRPEALEAFARRVKAIAPQATGVPISVTEAGDVVQHAFAEAIAYTVMAIAIVVIVLRRRLSDVLLVLAPLAVASVWTVAASAILDLPFNFANVIVIPLLIGLGVASSVHMVVRARELAQGASGIKPEVMDTSTPLAVMVAQLNTVAAFATLAVSAHRGLFSMGLLLGLAILFVLIASLIVLPAAMVAIRRPGSQRPFDGDAA